MPEQRFEVKAIGVEYICDACQEGKMVQHDRLFYENNLIMLPHKCDKCGLVVNFEEKKYPTVIHERVLDNNTKDLLKRIEALEKQIEQLNKVPINTLMYY